MKYSDKFLDPRWQKRRLDILNRDAFTCIACGNTKETLHVHHKYYIQHRDPWDYPDFALITLCKDCHTFLGGNTEEYPASFHRVWETFLNTVAPLSGEVVVGFIGAFDMQCKMRGIEKGVLFAALHDFLNNNEQKVTDLIEAHQKRKAANEKPNNDTGTPTVE